MITVMPVFPEPVALPLDLHRQARLVLGIEKEHDVAFPILAALLGRAAPPPVRRIVVLRVAERPRSPGRGHAMLKGCRKRGERRLVQAEFSKAARTESDEARGIGRHPVA